MRAWRTFSRRVVIQVQRQRRLTTCLQLSHRRVPTNEALLEVLDTIEDNHAQDNEEHASVQDTSPKTQQLPPSPLTDPKLNAARFGHKAPKNSPRQEELSGFQLKLQKNPYAHALATPPRYCLLTGARLPSYFLLRFGLASHPETGQTWHLPSLAADVAAAEASGREQQEHDPSIGKDERLGSKEPNQAPESQTLPPRTLSGSHFLSSYTALDYISRLRLTKYRSLIPYRWREEGALNVKSFVWREDMGDFTLELMRKQAVRQILRLTNRKSAMYFVPCEDWEDVKKKSQVGAVLWLGGEDEGKIDCGDAGESEPREPPLYAMLNVRGNDLPVYNLRTLLGHQHVKDLRFQLPATFSNDLVSLKAKRMTVDLQLWLWKLTGYLSP